MRAVPRLCEFYPGICLTTEEKARKNLSQGSRRVTDGGTNFILRIKEQETRLTLQEHDDDDDDDEGA